MRMLKMQGIENSWQKKLTMLLFRAGRPRTESCIRDKIYISREEMQLVP